jgi:ubiquinone/menaquinone biosynthesis C-methylase UbiE
MARTVTSLFAYMEHSDKKDKKIKKDTSWQNVAGWYDDLLAGDDTYQTQVILPNVLRLVAPHGKTVLDIACGQGFFSKAFADAGAKMVVGVDLSHDLIQKAKANNPKAVLFGVSPADKIFVRECVGEAVTNVTADNSFDVATIVLALQNIKEMTGTIKEASRVLRQGGTFVIVLNHPCFRIPRASSWGFDEKKDVQFRRIDGYGRPFTFEIDMTPGEQKKGNKQHTVSFHHPLQDYFKALAAAGFVVSGLEEWISHKKSEPGPRAKAEDLARVEFPMFMAIVARKL